MAGLDFRQIGTHDYGQLFLLLYQLGLGPESRGEVFRRMVFNVAGANCDDHTKNFSFVLRQNGVWALSPAYDVTHAYSPTSRWTRQHLMAVNGQTTRITRADVLEVADRFAVPGVSDIMAEVLDAVEQWPAFAQRAGVPDRGAEMIARDIETWSAHLR
jgi:serine/threonine-protein kinase HipA